MVFFTSIISNYMAKARILCKSVKEYNPEAVFILGLCDTMPADVDVSNEPFDTVLAFDKLERIQDKHSFCFKHTITELCTAAKPFFAEETLKIYKADAVVYLDPDIAVFDSLAPLKQYFEKGSIILTPHQLAPETHDLYVKENEILFLKRGTFNLGFFGVKNDRQGMEFLRWWQDRVNLYCFDDDYEVLPELARDGLLGLFTDQKWIDLVPSLFESHVIIRDPGYNVCTWNLSNRHVVKGADGRFTVNGQPLRFFHFSGYDNGGHKNELSKSLTYYPHNKDVWQLTRWYDKKLEAEGQAYFENIPCEWNQYSNGETIHNFERKLYHIRRDVYAIVGDPFEVSKEKPCFYQWVRNEYTRYFDTAKREEENLKFENGIRTIINRFFPPGTRRRSFLSAVFKRLLKKKENGKGIKRAVIIKG